MEIISGIHPVLEAIRAGRQIDRVLVARGASGSRLQEVIDLARSRGLALRFEPRAALDRMASTAAHQGVIAVIAPYPYLSLEDIPANAQLLVALDGVEDPHNLGAIARSALAAGVRALIIPERRSAAITDAAAKAAAGAFEHLPVVRVTNLNRALDRLKERGFWIYGLDERGPTPHYQVEYLSPTLFVLGGEARGLHQQVKQRCDVLVRIPTEGPISSLNVSVAAGIVLFEWKRRRVQIA